MLRQLPKEEWYEVYIRYALYFGAIFQLVCILAVIFIPAEKADSALKGDLDEDDEEEDLQDQQQQQQQHNNRKKQHRSDKHHKKKKNQ